MEILLPIHKYECIIYSLPVIFHVRYCISGTGRAPEKCTWYSPADFRHDAIRSQLCTLAFRVTWKDQRAFESLILVVDCIKLAFGGWVSVGVSRCDVQRRRRGTDGGPAASPAAPALRRAVALARAWPWHWTWQWAGAGRGARGRGAPPDGDAPAAAPPLPPPSFRLAEITSIASTARPTLLPFEIYCHGSSPLWNY